MFCFPRVLLSCCRHLLTVGLAGLEGVVYLDDQDKKMIVTRAGGMRPLLLADCHVPPDLRFTFYDQVHTTGKSSIILRQVEEIAFAVILGCSCQQLVTNRAAWLAENWSPRAVSTGEHSATRILEYWNTGILIRTKCGVLSYGEI